nr:4246_t:CDS:2 [Entrophospora candida]
MIGSNEYKNNTTSNKCLSLKINSISLKHDSTIFNLCISAAFVTRAGLGLGLYSADHMQMGGSSKNLNTISTTLITKENFKNFIKKITSTLRIDTQIGGTYKNLITTSTTLFTEKNFIKTITGTFGIDAQIGETSKNLFITSTTLFTENNFIKRITGTFGMDAQTGGTSKNLITTSTTLFTEKNFIKRIAGTLGMGNIKRFLFFIIKPLGISNFPVKKLLLVLRKICLSNKQYQISDARFCDWDIFLSSIKIGSTYSKNHPI